MKQSEKQQLGAAIRRCRRKQDITQEDLSQFLGFKSKATISKIESGEYTLEWRTMLMIAGRLNDPNLLLQWWQLEKAKMVSQTRELRRPLKAIDELLSNLAKTGAFAARRSRD